MDYDSYFHVTFPRLTPEDADRQVRLFLWKMGLRALSALVVNHTAIDSPLVKEQPNWYQYDESGKVQPKAAFHSADLAGLDDHQRLWIWLLGPNQHERPPCDRARTGLV